MRGAEAGHRHRIQVWNLGLARAYKLHVDPIKEGAIRIFGVSLLAVAALAAAGLLWKRRREELLARVSLPRERDLEDLRQAGF